MKLDTTDKHLFGYKQLFVVLLALLILTGLTVFCSQYDFGAFNICIALLIASAKGALVVLFFMHLKYESLLIKGSFASVLIIYCLVITLMLFDVAYRYN